MAKTKFFRVMTEGDTTDGRKIDPSWIEQMARNYNPTDTFAARIWIEHLRGLSPDSTWRAYGDVLELKAEKLPNGKLALFASIDPTPDLVAMNKARQKMFTSCEVSPDFANTGEAYLTGLAVTDDPASLGTEMLQFSASAVASPLAARKQSADNLFTAAQPITLEFEENAMDPKDKKPDDKSKAEEKTLLSKITDLLAGKKEEPAAPADKFSEDAEAAFTALATAHAEQATQVKDFAAAREADAVTIKALGDKVESLSAALTTVTAAFDAFKAQMDETPEGERRPAANGGGTADPDLGL